MSREIELFTAHTLRSYVIRKYIDTGLIHIQAVRRDPNNTGIEVTIKAPTPIQLIIEVMLDPDA